MSEQVSTTGRGLTAGQKAAATRAANKANGTPGQAGTTSSSKSETPRADGLIVQMWIHVHPNSMEISFRGVDADGKARGGFASSEAFLQYLCWRAYPDYSTEGELGGFEQCVLRMSSAGASVLENVLPLMRRSDKMIELARDQSDDLTFAFVASTLALHFRVGSIHVKMVDGSEFSGKRGAAYVTVLRLSDAFTASHAKPKPETLKPPVPAKAEKPKPEPKAA